MFFILFKYIVLTKTKIKHLSILKNIKNKNDLRELNYLIILHKE